MVKKQSVVASIKVINKCGLLIIIWLCSGCCALIQDFSQRSISPIVGSWVYKTQTAGPMILTFTNDRRYLVDFNGDGQEDIWGKYELLRNRIRMDYEDAIDCTDCYTPGFYFFYIRKNELVFGLIADQCSPRRMSLSVPRTRHHYF